MSNRRYTTRRKRNPGGSAVSGIARLRSLRRQSRLEVGNLVSDLKRFLHQDGETFRRLPTTPSEPDDISISTTCTALMVLAVTRELDRFYLPTEKNPKDIKTKRRNLLVGLFKRIFKTKWASSGLKEGNAFTATLVLRTIGLLVSMANDLGLAGDLRALPKKAWRSTTVWRLQRIANTLANDTPLSLRIDESLRENPALGYWLVDGVSRIGLRLTETQWNSLARWGASEFAHQLSLFEGQDDAMMDPIALVMAACLTKRLRELADGDNFADPVRRTATFANREGTP